MKIWTFLTHLLLRYRYPVSLPEEVADALGIKSSNSLKFEEFVQQLIHPSFRPTRLIKFMPREKAEASFSKALKKECFKQNSLFSYYFSEGWLEFDLFFDEQSRLRRIYLQHRNFIDEGGIEIQLNKCNGDWPPNPSIQ